MFVVLGGNYCGADFSKYLIFKMYCVLCCVVGTRCIFFLCMLFCLSVLCFFLFGCCFVLLAPCCMLAGCVLGGIGGHPQSQNKPHQSAQIAISAFCNRFVDGFRVLIFSPKTVQTFIFGAPLFSFSLTLFPGMCFWRSLG